MRKSMKIRIICLAVAGVMLSGALSVAAMNGSPYEILKNAFFNALFYDNYVLEGESTITINGEVYESSRMSIIQNESAFLERVYDSSNGSQPQERLTFTTDSLHIQSLNNEHAGGIQWYSVQTIQSSEGRLRNWHGMELPWQNGSTQMRFFEVALDLIVGDLKHNVNMSADNGIRRISGSITHSQLPEIVRLGIDMMVEENLRWETREGSAQRTRDDFKSPIDIPVQSLTFNSISGEAEVDSMGNLLYLNAHAGVTVVNIFGDTNVFEFSAVLRFSDIGTAVINDDPISEAVELFAPGFMQDHLGRIYGQTAYFKLNDDGSINHDSIAGRPGTSEALEEISKLADENRQLELQLEMLETVEQGLKDMLDTYPDFVDITVQVDFIESLFATGDLFDFISAAQISDSLNLNDMNDELLKRFLELKDRHYRIMSLELFNEGQAQLAAGNTEEARRALRLSRGYMPADAYYEYDIFFALGQIAEIENDIDLAIQYYKRIVAETDAEFGLFLDAALRLTELDGWGL